MVPYLSRIEGPPPKRTADGSLRSENDSCPEQESVRKLIFSGKFANIGPGPKNGGSRVLTEKC